MKPTYAVTRHYWGATLPRSNAKVLVFVVQEEARIPSTQPFYGPTLSKRCRTQPIDIPMPATYSVQQITDELTRQRTTQQRLKLVTSDESISIPALLV